MSHVPLGSFIFIHMDSHIFILWELGVWILDVNSRLCLSQSLPLLPRSLSFSLSLSRADFPGCVYANANICLFHSDQVRCHCKKVARDALGQSGPSPADKWYHWLRLTCLWTVAGRVYGSFDFLQLGDTFIVPKYSAWSTGSLYILICCSSGMLSMSPVNRSPRHLILWRWHLFGEQTTIREGDGRGLRRVLHRGISRLCPS